MLRREEKVRNEGIKSGKRGGVRRRKRWREQGRVRGEVGWVRIRVDASSVKGWEERR